MSKEKKDSQLTAQMLNILINELEKCPQYFSNIEKGTIPKSQMSLTTFEKVNSYTNVILRNAYCHYRDSEIWKKKSAQYFNALNAIWKVPQFEGSHLPKEIGGAL